MTWEWDDSGDTRLFDLWRLREELASSRFICYGKFYQNRATVFSKKTLIALMAILETPEHEIKNHEARKILELLEVDSPLSTKQIKEMAELKGTF